VVSAAEQRAAKKAVQRLEKQLTRLAAEESRLHEQMAADPTDFEATAKLDARLRELLAEKDELELEWLEAAELAE
jgi:ATP-binding cassette subfamily F protein uup